MTGDRLPPTSVRARRWARPDLAVALLIGALAVLTPVWLPAPAASAAPTDSTSPGWVDTKYGPLGPGDMDLLAGVRRAGLWEIPAGQMAATKGRSQRVREVGAEIAEQHQQLDEIVRAAAAKLNVALPSQPNADQQGWLDEMEAASGTEFDTIFVDRLRQAHGKVYSLIASVRAGTRNEVVRDLADDANKFVNTHMNLLESSGLVDFDSLPTPNAVNSPSAAGAGTGGGGTTAKSGTTDTRQVAQGAPLVDPKSSDDGGLSPLVIWVVLIAATVAGGLATLRVIRSR